MNKRKIRSLFALTVVLCVQSLSTFAFLSSLYGWSLMFFLFAVFFGWVYIKVNHRPISVLTQENKTEPKQPIIHRSVNHRQVLNQQDDLLKKALDENEKRMQNIHHFLYTKK